MTTSARLARSFRRSLGVVRHPQLRNRAERTWLAEEQAALRRVATLVAGGAAPLSLLAVVAEEVAHVVDVSLVSIVRYEADGTATELASFSPRGAQFSVGPRWSLAGITVPARERHPC